MENQITRSKGVMTSCKMLYNDEAFPKLYMHTELLHVPA